MKNHPQILMVALVLKLFLGYPTAIAGETLPCLDSSKECVEQLTEKAIANSPKLKTLDDRIALIDKRLGVSADSIDYAESKLWTNYLPSSSVGGNVLDIINPFAWIKNLAGGGEMQRDRLEIADLEVKAATLEAARAELERQREEEKVNLGEKVLRLVLDYEAVARKVELVRVQLQTYNQQQEILRIRYRLGEGETSQFLESQVRGNGLRSASQCLRQRSWWSWIVCNRKR